MIKMQDTDQQFRLRKFWSTTVFSLGVLWGVANLIYWPVAALTSIVGSTWLEVAVIFAGGLLTLAGAGAAFIRFRMACVALLSGGVILLLLGIAGQVVLPTKTHGLLNLFLLYLAGAVPVTLGVFGTVTQSKGWPSLR